VTVIYFYSTNEKCPTCEKESAVLDYFKTQLKQNFLVFAIDEQFGEQEQLTELLKQTYNVTSYPTLIINGDNIYGEFVNKETLTNVVCNIYKTEDNRKIICE
jgi:thiol-disulfide isomerase/thioredoxin